MSSKHKFEYDLKAIFDDLIFSRILNPSSKLSSYNFCKSLLEPPTYELHDVYRSLHVLADNSDYIQAELYRNSQFLQSRDTSVLYYDCTKSQTTSSAGGLNNALQAMVLLYLKGTWVQHHLLLARPLRGLSVIRYLTGRCLSVLVYTF